MSFTADDYSNAALKEIGLPFLGYSLGGEPPETTARVRQQIAARRAWAEALEDPNWKRAYLGWVDHAAFCCERSEEAYRNRGAENAAREARAEKERERQRRAQALREAGQPVPPR